LEEKLSQYNLLSPSHQLQKDPKMTDKSNVLPFINTKTKFGIINDEDNLKETTVKIKYLDKSKKKIKAMSLLK
jgi:hypothetical protein